MSSDNIIWDEAWNLIAANPTSPDSLVSQKPSKPVSRHTDGWVDSSEYRKVVHNLKRELGHLYVGVPNLLNSFFPSSYNLRKVSKRFFTRCTRGEICDGKHRRRELNYINHMWKDWPTSAVEEEVIQWLYTFCKKLEKFARPFRRQTSDQRALMGSSGKTTGGAVTERKLDAGFIYAKDLNHGLQDGRYNWCQILVPGELNSKPTADNASEAWLDLATHAREVLIAQPTRRFVLGFTLCGSVMRVWVFDRIGGIASQQIDINKEPVQFIQVILGFLWMSEEDLGFDPTIKGPDGQQFIEIERDGKSECIVIKELIFRSRGIVGRGTTCWRAYNKDHPEKPLVIKDSWQLSERDEEGEMLLQADRQNAINVARYYHHETVRVRGMNDDARDCIRRGLDITTASNYQQGPSQPPSRATTDLLWKRPTTTSTSTKRSRSSRETVSQTPAGLPNRVHRRVIVKDYGKPIFEASSCKALLACLEGCIIGHQSLYDKGILHRDISPNNLMINEDPDNSSWSYFLTDLDLAVEKRRKQPTGAQGRTGTTAFMAILLLRGQEHSFMHDLESFFWVLFWICINFEAPGKQAEPKTSYDVWDCIADTALANLKAGLVFDEGSFMDELRAACTEYYKPLIPHVNKLRQKVFPDGKVQHTPNRELYSEMIEVLREAQEDA